MISVTVLVKNNAETIAALLESVQSFPEVIVLDTGSTDATLEIVRSYKNTKIYYHTLTNFGEAYNKVASYVTNPWVLSLDSDEALSLELIANIHALKLDPRKIYQFRRINYLNGKKICFSGWRKDDVQRLYHSSSTQFKEVKVHPKLADKGFRIERIQGALLHYPYLSISSFLHKMQMYTSFFAEQHAGIKKSSFTKAYVHGLYAFFKSFFLQAGILDGQEGYIISSYNAQTAFYKYLKLRELNKKLTQPPQSST
jgi:glycosyltransferase involved in cell wall biosynthesis